MKKSTPREREKDEEYIRMIQAAQIPIFIEPEDEREREVSIRQDDAHEGMVFDFGGGTGLILPLWIIPNISDLVISGVGIGLLRWPNGRFQPLEERGRGEWPQYCFSGRTDLKFGSLETINHFIADRTPIVRGSVAYGRLLLSSFDPLPDEIRQCTGLHGSVAVRDQWDREHSAKFHLRVDREFEQRVSRDRRRRSLFECPDFAHSHD